MRMHDLTGFNFTVHSDPEINRVIAGQLRRVAEEMLDLLGDRLFSVLIAGGFGRGEGGVVRDVQGIRPINDYDFYLVVKDVKKVRRQFGNQIEKLAQRLAVEFRIKQVDLGLVSRWQLWIPRDSVTRYEAAFGHQIVYGPESVCIRSVKAPDIPLAEGAQYFFTRGGGLLIARCILENKGHYEALGMPWVENFSIEMNKAAIALGDAELILRRQYHWSYVERLRRFEALFDHKTCCFFSLYREAVTQKLNPQVPFYAERDLEGEWTALARVLSERFLVFEENRLGCAFTDLEEYERFIANAKLNVVGRLYSCVYATYSGRRRADPDRQRALVYLLLSGIETEKSLEAAERMLGLNDKSEKNRTERWLDAVEVFLKNWHPGGVVAHLFNR